MNETLIYTDSRPRAKSTGHAFGFEGNLGIPVIISGLLSVLVMTLLLNRENGMPLLAEFDTPGSFLAPIRQNKNRRHVPQLFGSVYLSAGGSILVSGVVVFQEKFLATI